jgi:hypothetical protein
MWKEMERINEMERCKSSELIDSCFCYCEYGQWSAVGILFVQPQPTNPRGAHTQLFSSFSFMFPFSLLPTNQFFPLRAFSKEQLSKPKQTRVQRAELKEQTKWSFANDHHVGD